MVDDKDSCIVLKHPQGIVHITVSSLNRSLAEYVRKSIRDHFNGRCNKDHTEPLDFASLFGGIYKHG